MGEREAAARANASAKRESWKTHEQMAEEMRRRAYEQARAARTQQDGEFGWALRELGLKQRGASVGLEDVKGAYRTEALRRHPDRAAAASGDGGGAPTESFARLSAAYEIACKHLDGSK